MPQYRTPKAYQYTLICHKPRYDQALYIKSFTDLDPNDAFHNFRQYVLSRNRDIAWAHLMEVKSGMTIASYYQAMGFQHNPFVIQRP